MAWRCAISHINWLPSTSRAWLRRRGQLVSHHALSEAISSTPSRRTMASKVSALSLTSKRRAGRKITMVTAYDFPSAVHVARAGMDVILVGDSVAMVELGYDTTQPLTMTQALHHCQAVRRGVDFANVENTPLLVGDMPFGSYEYANTDIALENAYRFIKEAGMDAVKIEVHSSEH
jgi:3-methyl-2-oxobutanoate hydroxymethyltransferase